MALAGNGPCATVRLDGPVRLPDGTVHAAHTLTLCVGEQLSPIATLHETYIDRRPVALLASRNGVAEGLVADGPFMMFRRETGGALSLYGFAVPISGKMMTYRLQDHGPRRKPPRSALASGLTAARTPMLLAARLQP